MGFAALLSQSFRMTLRDWRSGEVRLLVVALAVAVAALSSVAFFRGSRAAGPGARCRHVHRRRPLRSTRIGRSTRRSGPRPAELGLQVAQTVTFPSMAVSGPHPERNVLAALKAVSSAYPLRGTIKLRGAQGDIAAAGGPEAGTAWVDPQLLDSLGPGGGPVDPAGGVDVSCERRGSRPSRTAARNSCRLRRE